MTKRWTARLMGGAASLILCASVFVALTTTSLLKLTGNTVQAAARGTGGCCEKLKCPTNRPQKCYCGEGGSATSGCGCYRTGTACP